MSSPPATAPVPPSEPAVSPTVAARALHRAGVVLGAALVLGAAITGAGEADLQQSVLWTAVFGLTGCLFAWCGGRLLTRLALRTPLGAELTRGNGAAALLAGAHQVSTALVAASVLYGRGLTTWIVSAAFFWIGTGTLLLFQLLHHKLTRYADDQELRGENVAAALALAGLMLALALIVGHALEGEFQGWATSLQRYGLALLLAATLYPVRQVVTKRLLLGFPLALRGRRLDRAIAQERQPLVGAVEAAAYLAVALLVTGAL